MYGSAFNSNTEILLYAMPMVVALLLGFLGLGEVIAAPRKKVSIRQPSLIYDTNGEPVLSDPDGRPWKHSDRIVKQEPPATRNDRRSSRVSH